VAEVGLNGIFREMISPRFLWGVLIGLFSAGLWVTIQFGHWSRQDERTRQTLMALERTLQERGATLDTIRQRGEQNYGDVRRLVEDVAALKASRMEDDRATQAQALRDAEFRARIANQIERMADQVSRLTGQLAPRQQGGPNGTPAPTPDWRLHREQQWGCKNRYSTCRTVSDGDAMDGVLQCFSAECAVVKPDAFGAPLRGCGA
jgi:hypothetical protein